MIHPKLVEDRDVCCATAGTHERTHRGTAAVEWLEQVHIEILPTDSFALGNGVPQVVVIVEEGREREGEQAVPVREGISPTLRIKPTSPGKSYTDLAGLLLQVLSISSGPSPRAKSGHADLGQNECVGANMFFKPPSLHVGPSWTAHRGARPSPHPRLVTHRQTR